MHFGAVLTSMPSLPSTEALKDFVNAQWLDSIITIVIAAVLWRLLDALIVRFFARRFVKSFIPRVSTYASLTKTLTGVIILFFATVEVLNIWNVNAAPALWSATAVSAALAFGAQAIIKDVLTGVFYLFEDPFDVGDGVEITTLNGVVTGRVEFLGLRQTRVVDGQRRTVSIPNGTILYVANATRIASRRTVKITVPLQANVSTLREQIATAAAVAARSEDIEAGSVVVRIDDSTASNVTYAIEFQTTRIPALAAESGVREHVLVTLQTDGVLPSQAPPPAQA